ncbi:hypothetical protein FSARC_11908 [Fusarium sarcochroum]|uniref:Uncharacterized protein n=1 Tax=Fusarium sarcochroum TaxID=1208366 RepID=A0A8H4WZ12_9HYPO|nr:hypothetical protein FSARC_11908 [Fusarium sarcochroum]
MEIASPPPAPPSEEEVAGYYGGVPGRPRLVARSNAATEPWSMKSNTFEPIGQHPLVLLWNGSTGPLWRDILKALEETEWITIDIFRIGYESKGNPVKLLVTVEQGSTNWLAGWVVATKCRDVLREYGIMDVEVEFKEGQGRITDFCAVAQDELPMDMY